MRVASKSATVMAGDKETFVPKLGRIRARGGKVGWVQALGRYLAAVLSVSVLGLGFVWIAVDPQRRSWHDLLSATRLVVAPSLKAS